MSTSPDTVVERRAAIRKMYAKSATWQIKVDNMTDEQVTAIYLRLKAKGKLG